MPRILAVDDEKAIADIIEQFLIRNGFTVVSLNDAEEALEIVRGPEKFDLIVLDIKMPKLSGVDILKDMRERQDKTPVVILSGSIGIQENVDVLRELGYDEEDILYKPIDLFELLARIKKELSI